MEDYCWNALAVLYGDQGHLLRAWAACYGPVASYY